MAGAATNSDQPRELESWRRFVEARYDMTYAASSADLVVLTSCSDGPKKQYSLLDNLRDLAYVALHAPQPREIARTAYWRLVEEVSGGAVKCAGHGVAPERDRRRDLPCAVCLYNSPPLTCTLAT